MITKHIKIYNLDNYKKLYDICGVYTFIDKSNTVVYIGSSCDIGIRIEKHTQCLKINQKCNKKLLEMWDNNYITHIGLLEECETPLEAQQKEHNYIKKWPNKLLNISSNYKIKLSEENIERFWSRVNIKGINDCWKWLGTIASTGYGKICISSKQCLAHRISFQIDNPNICLDGTIIRHLCNNRLCVNPNHLKIGSQQDNMRDRPEIKKYKAFGEEKYLREWVKDKRCKVDYNVFTSRLYENWDIA